MSKSHLENVLFNLVLIKCELLLKIKLYNKVIKRETLLIGFVKF